MFKIIFFINKNIKHGLRINVDNRGFSMLWGVTKMLPDIQDKELCYNS